MSRRTLALFTALILTTATAACGDDDSPTTSTPGKPDQVKAGVIAILDVAPIYLGKEKGFFSKRNIELTLETAQGGSAIAPSVLSGQYQFGFSNVVSLLLAKSQNAPLKAVANGVNSTGDPKADFGGIVVKDPAITSPKQLEGKKVATNALKNIVDTSVKDIVKKDGGDPNKVSFVELAFPDMAAQLDAGNVQAIFVVEPFLSAAKAKGWRTIGSYADVDPNLCVALYFTSQQQIQSNPDLVKRFTEAMNESLTYANSHPDEVRAALGTYTQITEQVRKSLTLPKWPSEIDKDAINKLADLAVTYGLLKSKPDVDSLLP
ncbi:ABC transporter substrate-binding protein [Virgisporangium aurantiacum]|uniref:ABC transporter substrate-binding protein n=1 Tax=Virgisporangium aurantiacum TaxID=175570 RepID=UPI00195093C0|nr:ABC transporter substrate-binding protein [Virgisporangium aurantiacum]